MFYLVDIQLITNFVTKRCNLIKLYLYGFCVRIVFAKCSQNQLSF